MIYSDKLQHTIIIEHHRRQYLQYTRTCHKPWWLHNPCAVEESNTLFGLMELSTEHDKPYRLHVLQPSEKPTDVRSGYWGTALTGALLPKARTEPHMFDLAFIDRRSCAERAEACYLNPLWTCFWDFLIKRQKHWQIDCCLPASWIRRRSRGNRTNSCLGKQRCLQPLLLRWRRLNSTSHLWSLHASLPRLVRRASISIGATLPMQRRRPCRASQSFRVMDPRFYPLHVKTQISTLRFLGDSFSRLVK